MAILPVSLNSLDPGGSAPNSETKPPQSLSSADTKYPIIQVNSDTNYLELASDSPVLIVYSHETAPLQIPVANVKKQNKSKMESFMLSLMSSDQDLT